MIKKISLLFTVVLMIFITGCEGNSNKNIMFDNEELIYIDELANGYTLYRLGSTELEAMLIENETINASYVKDDDVFLISGETDSFVISKNGTTVLTCSGEELVCSGIENLDFKDDISNIYDALYVKDTYVFQIIGGIITMISIVIFVIPLKIVKVFKKNIRNYNVLPIRLLAMFIFIVGLTFIFTL
jgi:hypothetical protein